MYTHHDKVELINYIKLDIHFAGSDTTNNSIERKRVRAKISHFVSAINQHDKQIFYLNKT